MLPSPIHRHGNGFTLIEMSIILVVISLISGGVLLGRDLIRIAELRRISTKMTEFNTAVLTFRNKYNALPGDFSKATEHFGTDPGGCPGMYRATFDERRVPQDGTCNGNGNGRIDDFGSGDPSYNEPYLFWQQLAASALITGKYTGMGYPNGPGSAATPGINCPVASYNGDGPYVLVYNTSGINLDRGQHTLYKHVYILLNGSNIVQNGQGSPKFSPNDSRWLDTKFDDGMPRTGGISTLFNHWVSNCDNGTNYNASDEVSPSADINNASDGCGLVVQAPF